MNVMERKKSLLITARDNDDHVTVMVSGEINSSTAPKMEADFRTIITSGCPRLAVSLEDVSLVTSAGLRVLLVLTKETNRAGGKIVWYGSRRNVLEVFGMTGFDAMLDLATSYESALAAIASARAVCAPGEEVFVPAHFRH